MMTTIPTQVRPLFLSFTFSPNLSLSMKHLPVLTPSDSEISADDDYDALPSESLSDRLSALQDIIPPKTRGQLSSAASSLYNGTAAALNFSGKALWVISTGVMLVGIPYAWSVLEESQLLEQEREAQMFKEGQGMLNADEKGDGAKASL